MRTRVSYFICTTVRSGSNLLCEILRGSGLAGCPDEYFYSAFYPRLFARYGADSFESYVPRVLETTTSENGVFGAKMMASYFFHQFAAEVRQLPIAGEPGRTTAELLARAFPGLRYIWLTRRDKVRQAISHLRAAQTGVWHSAELDGSGAAGSEASYSYEGLANAILSDAAGNAEWQQYFSDSAIVPLSPAPFTPSGLWGDGVSMRPISNFGNDSARGIAYSIIEPVRSCPPSS
jgi:LPS sulfotransferase NodH